MSSHRCFREADRKLAAKNTRLAFALAVGPSHGFGAHLVIATEKVDAGQRGKPVKIMATHCPFCGVKL